jgi:UDP-glucose 4-epimerase
MKILVTGSAGHLGEALVRTLRGAGHEVLGLDIVASPFTQVVGSITDRSVVRACMVGVQAVLHSATLHKPHVATHARQDFVDTNITGTLNLLEEAVAAGVGMQGDGASDVGSEGSVGGFVFTSTTSAFGRALSAGGGAATWITEDVVPVPKNIYGVTKVAAENLCELFAHRQGLPCVVLRTSRFFPEADDNPATRAVFQDANTKANELLYRRADIADMVSAHLLAMDKSRAIGFGRYIISASTPFVRSDLAALHQHAPDVLSRYFPDYAALYAQRGWKMFDSIDRVYVNDKARAELGWQPRYGFAHVLVCLRKGVDFRSPLAQRVGSKGYHSEVFEDGPFPVE